METVGKTQTGFPIRSHTAWKTARRRSPFTTVPTASTTTGYKTFRMEMYTGVRKTFQIGCLEDPQTLLLGEIVILRFGRFTERLHKTLLGLSVGIKLPYNREPVDRFCQLDKNTSTN